MRTAQPSEVATTAILAARYGVTERTIRRLCAAGRLPHHRLATVIRFTPEDQAAIEVATSFAPEPAPEPAPAPSLATSLRRGPGGQRPSTQETAR